MKKFNIAVVDDQGRWRLDYLSSLLHAGQRYVYGFPGITFSFVDVSKFRDKEDWPFFYDSDMSIIKPCGDFIEIGANTKSIDAYNLDPKSPYSLKVGWDGGHAVEFAREGLDLLIINREMVQMDGNEAIFQIRKFEPNLPIIIATMDSEPRLYKLKPPVIRQTFGSYVANVNGYLYKGREDRSECLGVQALALLHPQRYGHLPAEFEKQHDPIYDPNIEQHVRWVM